MKCARNLIKYTSVQHIWNLSQLFGLFMCCKRSWNFVTEMSKQCSKTTRHRLCCKKLGTSHEVKSFANGSFLDHNYCCWNSKWWSLLRKHWKCWSDQYKTDQFLVKFARKFPQNWLFFTDCFLAKFSTKIPMKSVNFSSNLSLKIPQNLAFLVTYQKPWLECKETLVLLIRHIT